MRTLALLLVTACSAREAPPSSPPSPSPPPSSPPPPPPACSAAGLSAALPGQDLPAPVAATRARLAERAVACDLEGLGTIARATGRPFSFSFGGGDDPVAFWRAAEADDTGVGPTEALVRVLALPPCRQDLGDRPGFVWPAAACGAPSPEAWAALRALYDDATLESFREAGGYMGWRTGITEDGGWTFFVAGD